MKAIETFYRDHHFRSRLEAKYAVFFDSLGEKWEYEKEGYDLDDGDYYLPDFWLPRMKMFVEVKGQEPDEREIRVARKLNFYTLHPVLICWGLPCENYGFLFDFDSLYNGGSALELNAQWTKHCEWLALTENPEREYDEIINATIAAKQARFEFGRPQQQVVDYDNIPF